MSLARAVVLAGMLSLLCCAPAVAAEPSVSIVVESFSGVEESPITYRASGSGDEATGVMVQQTPCSVGPSWGLNSTAKTGPADGTSFTATFDVPNAGTTTACAFLLRDTQQGTRSPVLASAEVSAVARDAVSTLELTGPASVVAGSSATVTARGMVERDRVVDLRTGPCSDRPSFQAGFGTVAPAGPYERQLTVRVDAPATFCAEVYDRAQDRTGSSYTLDQQRELVVAATAPPPAPPADPSAVAPPPRPLTTLTAAFTRDGRFTVTSVARARITVVARRGTKVLVRRGRTEDADGRTTFRLRLGCRRATISVTATSAGGKRLTKTVRKPDRCRRR